MRSQRGIITVDFMFAMVLVLGLTGLLFALTFTLSVASVTQYVTFAAARNYAVGHLTNEEQIGRANAKYKELTESRVLKPLYNNGWYSIDAQPAVGDQTKVIAGFEAATQGVNKFWGAGTNFTAKVLAFQIPFFGTTTPDSDDSGDGFKTYLGSFLGRDPTTEECWQFTTARWAAIRNLSVSGGASYSTGTSAGGYYPMTDDGC